VALLRSVSRFSTDPAARLDKLIADVVAKGEAVTLVDRVFHDLRRTVASGMARLGIPPRVCEKVLGHEEEIRGIAKIYNRFDYGDEKRRALQARANHVAAATNMSGKVFSLARRA
jgi:integrase